MTKLAFKRFILPVLALIGKGLSSINLRTKYPRAYYTRAREQLKKGKTVHGSLFMVFGIVGQEFLKRKLLLASLVILVILLPLVMFVLRGARSTEAAWYNDNWQYRQTVTITNSAGSNQTDFQIPITLDTATLISNGKMLSNCNDIRVTDINGKLLPQVIEEGSGPCNNAATKIWTKVPSITTSGTVLYIYYGNPSAANVESGANVFNFYDNFNDSALNGMWTVTGTSTIGGGTMTVSTGSVYSNNPILSDSRSYLYEYRAKWDSVVANYAGMEIGNSAAVQSGNAGLNKVLYSMSNAATNINQTGWAADGTAASYNLANNITLYTPTANTFYVDGIGMNTTDIYFYNNGTKTNSAPGSWTAAPYLWLGYFTGAAAASTNNTDITVDWVRVRKFATTPPTIGTPTNEEKSNGPYIYYKFDEGYGLTAYDSTLNTKNATLAGTSAGSPPTWQTEDQCISGKCLYFNGGNYIGQTPTQTISGNFTVSAWVKPTSTKTPMSIFSSRQPNDGAFDFKLQNGNQIHGDIGDGASMITVAADANFTYTSGNWYMITYVVTTTGYTIYANGNQVGSGTYASNTPVLYNTSHYIMIGSFGGSESFVGMMDEYKIYNYARSAAQVKADYAAGLAHAGSVKGINAALGASRDNNAALSQGLVGYWKADESSWTNNCSTLTVKDSSGNGNDGMSCPNTTGPTQPVSGKFGNGGYFDGVDDYVEVANSSVLALTNNITLAAWVKFASTGQTSKYIITRRSSVSGDSYAIIYGFTSNKYEFYAENYTGDNPRTALNTAVNDTNWHHIVWTYDGKTVNGYLDGVLDVSASKNTTFHTASAPVRLASSNASTNVPNATLDEARIYNRALNPAEVNYLYNWAPGPVGYWNFNEGTGTTTNDISGNSLSGAFEGNPTWQPGKFGRSIHFDGVGDDVVVSSGSTLGFTSPMTIEAWVNLDTTASEQHIAGKYNWGSSQGFELIVNSGVPWFRVYSVSGGKQQATSSISIGTNQWHHLTGTWDGSLVRIYVDGILQGSASQTTLDPSTSSFYIGRASDNSADAYRTVGFIDEVKTYNYARNSKQVVEDMNGGHPVGGSPVGSQIGYWRFDEGYGLTTYDGSPQGMNGTLNNFSSPASSTSGWTTNGKFNKALMFDGTNDYVSFATSPAQNPTVALSITSWIKTTGGAGTYRTIISKPVGVAWTTPYAVYNLRLSSSNKLEFWINDGSNAANYATSASTIPADSTWHHVAATYDGAVQRIYIDGVQNVQHSLVTTINGSTQPLVIGSHNGAANAENWFGALDEVKMYNTALTADDIKIDFNRGSALVLGSFSTDAGGSMPDNSAARGFCPPGDTTSCSPPIALWNFDEGSGTIVQDISGNSYPGSWAGTSSHYVPGKIGKAGNFGGSVPADAVTVTGGVALNSAFTLEAWINPQPFPVSTEWPILFRCKWVSTSGTCNYGFALYNNAGTYQFYNHVHQDPLPCNTWLGFLGPTWGGTFGAWNHVVMTFSGGTYTFYLNGINKGTVTTTNSLCQTTNDTTIGKGTDTSTGTYSYVTGQIDQAMIYNYARTGAQVAWDYNRGGAQINYRFDEGQGTTLNDSSGNGLNGIVSIGTTGSQTAPGNAVTVDTTSAWYNGRVGKSNYSLNFDGTDDYARTTPINTVPSGSYSISAWIKPASSGGVVVSELGASTPNSGWHDSQMEVETSGVVKTCLWSGSLTCVVAGTLASFNTWNHVVLTYNASTTTLSGYLNGQKGTSTTVTKQNPTTGVVYYSIGATDGTNGGNGSYFTGQVDEFRVFNYPLTNKQILTDYNQGAANFAPLTGSP